MRGGASNPYTFRKTQRAHEIAAASDRLAVLVMGTNDLAKETRARIRATVLDRLAEGHDQRPLGRRLLDALPRGRPTAA